MTAYAADTGHRVADSNTRLAVEDIRKQAGAAMRATSLTRRITAFAQIAVEARAVQAYLIGAALERGVSLDEVFDAVWPHRHEAESLLGPDYYSARRLVDEYPRLRYSHPELLAEATA